MSTSNQPYITEFSILTSFLLTPSPLPTALPYSTFLSTCVPATYRSHSYVKRLYRDIQFQRNIDVDNVRQNIERECARSGVIKGRLARQIQRDTGKVDHGKKRKRTIDEREGSRGKKEHQDDEDDEEFDIPDQQIDTVMHKASAHPVSKSQPDMKTIGEEARHTSSSLLLSMGAAISSLEQEIDEITFQNSTLLTEMTETIGQLSDLRYGRFARPSGAHDQETIEDSIVEALEVLNGVSKRTNID